MAPGYDVYGSVRNRLLLLVAPVKHLIFSHDPTRLTQYHSTWDDDDDDDVIVLCFSK